MTAVVAHCCKGEHGSPRVPCFNVPVDDGSQVPSLWDSKSSCDISTSGSVPTTQGRTPPNPYCSLGIIIVVLGCAGMEKNTVQAFQEGHCHLTTAHKHCRDTLLSAFLISSLCFFKEFINICCGMLSSGHDMLTSI